MSAFPDEMIFIQRGWLSANHLLLMNRDESVLIDSGYVSHKAQTCSLLEHRLNGRPLDRLLNTHLHSDHCGGNAALKLRFPKLQIAIAPGQSGAVEHWDESILSYVATGQDCQRFSFDALLQPGSELCLAGRIWQVHAAPGHDPHSVMLFQPETSVLVSADALWENGFGVVFPEIEGADGFSGIAQSLDLIEQLAPRWVVPGHGSVFQDLTAALARARARLDGFRTHPTRHANHAAKVLLKFKLLDWQRIGDDTLMPWCQSCALLQVLHRRYFSDSSVEDWIMRCMAELVRADAAMRDGTDWVNA